MSPSDTTSPVTSPETQSISGVKDAADTSPPLEYSTAEFKPGTNFYLAFVSLCIITLAAAFDATSLSIALPIITEKLKGTAIEAFWSGTSFLVTSAVFQPVIAGMSHVFGRKAMVLVSSVFFGVGSILAAVAKSFTLVLVGRSIQGIGGGGILTLGEILVTDLVPLAARGAWFGFLGSMWAIGSVAGPMIGGAFAQRVTWRWIFWINVPIIGTGAIAIILFLKLDRLPGKVVDKIKKFDWFGSVWFIASTVSVLIPVTWGGVMYAWDSWRTLVPLLLGAAGLVVFALYEWRLSSRAFGPDGNPLPGDVVEPIIRYTIFANATVCVTFIETIIHGMILWSLLYYLPLYYEGVLGYTPIIAGVAVLPESSFVAPMSVIVGIVCAKTGRYRWAIWIGWILTTLGCGLLILLDPGTSIAAWVFLNVPVAIGTGMLFPAMGLAIQAAGRPQDNGHSAAFYSFTRVLGQSIGVAVGGVAFQNQLKQKLLSNPLFATMADAYSKDATALVGVIQTMQEGTEKTELIKAYADSLKIIWIVMCALSAAGLAVSLFTKAYTLNQEHKTLQGLDQGRHSDDPESKETL